MQPFRDWRDRLKRTSVRCKILAGIVGLIAAFLWYKSAVSTDAISSAWNMWAAIFSGVSMLFQAASAIADAIVPPSASWA